jgi:hypothetical protein
LPPRSTFGATRNESGAPPVSSIGGIKAQLTGPPFSAPPAQPPAAAPPPGTARTTSVSRDSLPEQGACSEGCPRPKTPPNRLRRPRRRRSGAEHPRGTGRLPGRARRRPPFPLARRGKRGEDRADCLGGPRQSRSTVAPHRVGTPARRGRRAAWRATCAWGLAAVPKGRGGNKDFLSLSLY